jgi:hypothetical protein
MGRHLRPRRNSQPLPRPEAPLAKQEPRRALQEARIGAYWNILRGPSPSATGALRHEGGGKCAIRQEPRLVAPPAEELCRLLAERNVPSRDAAWMHPAVTKGRRVQARHISSAKLWRDGADSCLGPPKREFPVPSLLSPCSLPVMPELSPCYPAVPRETAFFDQLIENKSFSAENTSRKRPGTGRKSRITGRNRERRGRTGA